jgi:2-polyprenyl-3-methyl-5-hydroxy-6-metoxy-1,4-benzoquinol methylase
MLAPPSPELTAAELAYNQLARGADWDRFANTYETQRRLELIFDRLVHNSEILGARLLDAGSGGGHFSQAAHARGARVVSLDVGTDLLTQVRRRCPRCRPVAGNVRRLPFPARSFDVVICTEVIEHTISPEQAICELSRVVADDGLLVLTVPCLTWQPLVRLATALKLRPYNGHENFVSFSALQRIVNACELTVEWAGGFNFCPIFSSRLDPLFRWFDATLGRRAPWLMVNLAIRARRLPTSASPPGDAPQRPEEKAFPLAAVPPATAGPPSASPQGVHD